MDITLEERQLPDARRTDEIILLARQDKNRFYIFIEMFERLRLLHLVLKIRHRAQPAHDDARLLFPHEIRQQAGKRTGAKIRDMRRRFPDQRDPLLDGKPWLFADIMKHTDDDLVEHLAGAFENINMSAGNGIETARANRSYHGYASCAAPRGTKILTCVVRP